MHKLNILFINTYKEYKHQAMRRNETYPLQDDGSAEGRWGKDIWERYPGTSTICAMFILLHSTSIFYCKANYQSVNQGEAILHSILFCIHELFQSMKGPVF